VKVCSKCKQSKALAEFYKKKTAKDGLNSHCMDCVDSYSRNHYRNNKEKVLSRSNAWAKSHPVSRKFTRLKNLYGVTREQYDKIFEVQAGCCKLCGISQTELKKTLVIDHNHKTGRIRGLLCNPCNAALGLFKENAETLKKAVEYVI
jgi:uncharacterized metal-binding protein